MTNSNKDAKKKFYSKFYYYIFGLFIVYLIGFFLMPILIFMTPWWSVRQIPIYIHYAIYKPVIEKFGEDGWVLHIWRKNAQFWCERSEMCETGPDKTEDNSGGHKN